MTIFATSQLAASPLFFAIIAQPISATTTLAWFGLLLFGLSLMTGVVYFLTQRLHATGQSFQRRRRLAQFLTSGNHPQDTVGVLQEVANIARDTITQANGTSIILWDKEQQRFETVMASYGEQDITFDNNNVRSNGATRWIIDNARPLVIDYLWPDIEGANPSLSAQNVQAYVGVPIMVERGVLGVLYVMARRSHAFTAGDLTYLKELAAAASSIIAPTPVYERPALVTVTPEERQHLVLPELTPFSPASI